MADPTSSNVEPIFHIAPRPRWQAAAGKERYAPTALDILEYIPCCFGDQIARVAEKHFQGEYDLVLLRIDPMKLNVSLKLETGTSGGEEYPHVFGPIPMDAVNGVFLFPPEPDGSFAPPRGLQLVD